MENPRQEAFKKLRPPCVELSSIGLKFRGHQSTASEVLHALERVHSVLAELGNKDVLDAKLAEYVFFPLSHIFNETRRLPARCLEVAVDCLRIIIAAAWRQSLSPQMGKQLLILLTFIVGGTPNLGLTSQQVHSQPEELAIAGFNCFAAIFQVLGDPISERTIYNEVGTATIVDQIIYLLLEGITDSRSGAISVAAAGALQALLARVTDRVVLASIMPRTVSSLTKTLKPTTQTRRPYRLIEICLQVLTNLLKAVLNDHVARSSQEQSPQPQQPSDKLVLDASWLTATATQVKLALANVIQIRRHERPEVQDAILGLCIMVIEDCQTTLKDSIPIVVETIVVLSDIDENQIPNNAYSTLKHLSITYPVIVDTLKESLHNWIVSFPRTMQSNDETAKQWGIKQISMAFQVISQLQSTSDILTSSLASGLCDSVAAAVNQGANALQPLSSYSDRGSLDIEMLNRETGSASFPPILLEHRSQQQTLKDLRSMISKLNLSSSGSEVTRSIMSRIYSAPRDAILPPFWLALTFLGDAQKFTASFDEFISFDDVELSSTSPTRASIIEELYYVALPLLDGSPAETSSDWRVSALALEAVALQAKQLGEAFRPELMDALYPTLQLLTSANPNLQRHAMVCLNMLTASCNYPDTSSMIIENVDYLVNSVSLKLNIFDVSPYPPQVLFMMVKLCGAGLIPYLDDLVDSMFGILDMYHGYPRLVELMFKTLAAIVEEGAKKPSMLAITSGHESDHISHHKRQYEVLPISTLAKDFAAHRAKRARYSEELPENIDEKTSHPQRPWAESETKDEPEVDVDSMSDILERESTEPLPPPREPEDAEKPLSKSHSLLLHIVKSIPSHLTSPSPYLRRSLLSILIRILPVLALNENSFLPLINELWPSVVARVTFPSSFTNPSSLTSLTTKETAISSTTQSSTGKYDLDFQEETFVIVAACNAIEAMCRGAGDFMASRIESAFPHWQRIYMRVWEKVNQDAERAIERRSQQRQRTTTTIQRGSKDQEPDLLLGLGLSQSPSSLITIGATTSTAHPFTPHHSIWRALASLFITILMHVRLPLSIGDQICSFLAAWISRFAGPDYYFQPRAKEHTATSKELPESTRAEINAVENAIQAMETWNADFTWFIFQQQRMRVREIVENGGRPAPVSRQKIMEVFAPSSQDRVVLFGGRVEFAEIVF